MIDYLGDNPFETDEDKVLQMLHYDRIDVGNDVAKSTNNKKDVIFHYCFFSHRVKFQNSVSNGWHNVTIL